MNTKYIKTLFMVFTLLSIMIVRAQAGSITDSTKMSVLSIRFNNYAGINQLQLKSAVYENAAHETFFLTTFSYFISNIKLKSISGKEFIVPQKDSYFLIRQDDSLSNTIKINVPEDEYSSITYTLGVDSLRSTMDVSERTGPLDPSGGMINGMYWSWNSGYIFMKLEGNSDQIAADRTGQHKFRFHIGGFGGYNKPSLNNIKTITLSLSERGNVRTFAGKESSIIIKADVLKVLDGKTNISLAKNSSVMFGDFSSLVAANYQEMFTHLATENAQ